MRGFENGGFSIGLFPRDRPGWPRLCLVSPSRPTGGGVLHKQWRQELCVAVHLYTEEGGRSLAPTPDVRGLFLVSCKPGKGWRTLTLLTPGTYIMHVREARHSANSKIWHLPPPLPTGLEANGVEFPILVPTSSLCTQTVVGVELPLARLVRLDGNNW